MSRMKEPARPRPVKMMKYILAGILICALAGGAGYFFGVRGSDNEREELSAVVLENQIMNMSQLVSVTYAYTNMAKYESVKEFYGVKLPLTTNGFILTYDGEIKAGVDLKQASVEAAGSRVVVTLPEAVILSHEIDENSVEIYDETTSIFNPFTVEDYTAFYQDQKEEMEKKAQEKGVLKEAEQQAEESIKRMLESFLPKGYEAEVRTVQKGGAVS